YLVFATLIVPSLGARHHPPRRRLALAYVVAVLGYALGLVLSAALDLPSGALIVWCLAALAAGVHACAPRRARPPGARDGTSAGPGPAPPTGTAPAIAATRGPAHSRRAR